MATPCVFDVYVFIIRMCSIDIFCVCQKWRVKTIHISKQHQQKRQCIVCSCWMRKQLLRKYLFSGKSAEKSGRKNDSFSFAISKTTAQKCARHYFFWSDARFSIWGCLLSREMIMVAEESQHIPLFLCATAMRWFFRSAMEGFMCVRDKCTKLTRFYFLHLPTKSSKNSFTFQKHFLERICTHEATHCIESFLPWQPVCLCVRRANE